MSQTIATLLNHSAGAQGWLEMGDLDTACGPRGSSSGKVGYTSNCNEYENGLRRGKTKGSVAWREKCGSAK